MKCGDDPSIALMPVESPVQEVSLKRKQGSIYLKIPPPPRGGGKYGMMGKKYHKNNARADKKGKKERKDKGKEKKSDKMTEQEQCFI